MNDRSSQGAGPLIGSVIITLVILAGSYYLFQIFKSLRPLNVSENFQNKINSSTSTVVVGSSADDSINKIEEETQTIVSDLNSLDSDLENLDLLVEE